MCVINIRVFDKTQVSLFNFAYKYVLIAVHSEIGQINKFEFSFWYHS